MNTILTTLNSKFTHTSLAVRSIVNWLSDHNIEARWMEFTINTPVYQIIGDLYREKPDILIFSVYIWNGTEIRMIAKALKKLLPQCKIIFGGPEVSYDSVQEMENNHWLDAVISGEGEQVVEQLVRAMQKNMELPDLECIPGLTWRSGNDIIKNSPQSPLEMDLLAFPYQDLEQLSNRILYYESSRGCPFNCSYCLSSATKGVRFRSDIVFETDMLCFLEANVMQVKFVDRTFNADPNRALRLWKWLAANDNGITNFHFEITAELLREEDLVFLSSIRPGLFQFEIGIQTTMPEASEAVNRRLSFKNLKEPVGKLLRAGNLHVHLDLIAGLPFETYERFLKSFDDVYGLEPQVLQLGFLKLIKGSGIRNQAEQYGYIYEDYQPYEVLKTQYIQFDELLKLKDIEVCLECLHNSKRFIRTLKYLLNTYKRPSSFYESFATWLRYEGYFDEAIKMEKWYQLLWIFISSNDDNKQHEPLSLHNDVLRLCLMLDYMSSLGKTPLEWMSYGFEIEVKEKVFNLAKTNELVSIIPSLEKFSPKERVKRVRYAGIDKKMTNLLTNQLLETEEPTETVKLSQQSLGFSICSVGNLDYDSHSEGGILVIDINSKHPVNEQHPIYLFV